MRYLLIMSVCTLLAVGCKSKDANKHEPGMVQNGPLKQTDSTMFTTIEWKEQTKHFDKITEGQKLDVNFAFKNTGDKPLVILNVQASCGCTVPDPPKEPIAPGAEGMIKATFNSEGKSGLVHKTLYVTANTKGTQQHELVFEVEVDKKK